MSKTTKLLLIIAAVLLVIALGVTVALVALSGDNTPGQQSGEAATYTIEVKSASGILLRMWDCTSMRTALGKNW